MIDMEKDFWGKKNSFYIVLSKHLWLKGKFSDIAIQRRIVHVFGKKMEIEIMLV